MECLRCGNKDPTYFYKGHSGYYCRKCIKFKRILIEEDIQSADYEVNDNSYEYYFDYQLTNNQKDVSKKTLSILKDKKDVLLYCVCGSGKTEISVESISDYLSRGLKVCYSIPRKEVVKELSMRFASIFPKAKIKSVYGNHHDDLYGDLIVCTTHQLFRYYQSFDLLILDEVDAFPLKGDETLMNIALRSCKGQIIFSTATIDEGLNKVLSRRNYTQVSLFTRPSNKPLIVPKVFISPKIGCLLYLFKIMHSMTNQCIIFVQNKKICLILYKLYSLFYSCIYVYSDLEKRDENIYDFKDKKYNFIFSTSVLERGITIKDVNVIILDFLRNRFDVSSLIQMLGRVGRSITNPYGQAYILSNKNDKEIKSSLSYIDIANSYL